MTENEKALELLEKINNGKISKEDWEKASDYAKNDLKRKAFIVVDEVLDAITTTTGHCELRVLDRQEVQSDVDYWNRVRNCIKNY